MTLLDIQKKVKERLEVRKKTLTQKELEQLFKPKTCRPLSDIFPKNSINIIAEVKKASPSEGDIAPHIDPVVVATEYINCGARALSILTEPDFFKGDLDIIRKVKRNLPGAFVLMKDFIFDEYQIIEGASAGADAILLIVAMLDKRKFKELYTFARQWGLNPLCEVHTEEEIQVALETKANFVGVNNRNLKTMKINLEISEKLAHYKSDIDVLVSESGFNSGNQLKSFSKLGFDGFLIGTQFMKAPSPGKRLVEVLKEASGD